jgi:threonine dehydrogenase-like Zn-dependent dehydrogenase
MYGLGLHVLGRGRIQPGEKVVILGAGKLGLSVLDVLLAGARPALSVVTDLKPDRLEMALELGADHALDVRREDPVARVLELTGGAGVDCVIEAVGHYHAVGDQGSPLGQAVQMIRNAGRIVTAGLGEQLSSLHSKTLVLKEAEIIASRVTRGEFPRAIALLGSGQLHPGLLITHHGPLGEAGALFERIDRDETGTLKVVLDHHPPV